MGESSSFLITKTPPLCYSLSFCCFVFILAIVIKGAGAMALRLRALVLLQRVLSAHT